MNQMTSPWKNLPPMTTKRSWFATAVLRGKLYAVGGQGEECGTLSPKGTIELYDVNERRWTQAPNKMITRRYGCAAATIGNSIYVAGGCGDLRYSNTNTVEAFDVDTGSWRTLPSMSTAMRFGCAGVAVGDEFIVFGGRNRNTAELFNIRTGRWEDLPFMNNIRYGCAAAVINNKVYVVGGYDRPGSVLDMVSVFDMTTRKWALLPRRMTSQRAGCAVAAVGNYLVVAGGNDGASRTLNTVEMYDVDAERWTELPSMSTKRSGCAAVSLGGSVFVMGGYDIDRSRLDSVEEIQFSDDIVKEMLVGWNEGSWMNEVAPILHQRTSLVHSISVDVPLMPTLLSNVAKEWRVQTVFRIIRGEMSIFEHTTG